jgi:hypothetical protein
MNDTLALAEKVFERSHKQMLQMGMGLALGIVAVLGFLFRFLAK